MPTIFPIALDKAQGAVRDTLAGIKAKLGMLPNLFGVMAHAPAVLNSYLAFSETLGKGHLPAKYREQIAIAVASRNGCEYCLSAHTALGKMAGVDQHELEQAQGGKSSDPKAQAVLDLALELNKTHGKGSAAAFTKAHAAGLTEEDILEVAANVALNVLTNSINGLAETTIDFPKVTLNKAA